MVANEDLDRSTVRLAELDSTEADGSAPRDLPAPYVSPWSELGRTLNALVADLQLRAQELLRRNREGSLLLPGFWPQDLAPIFWPLVLVLGIGAVTVLAWLGFHSWADRTPQTLPRLLSALLRLCLRLRHGRTVQVQHPGAARVDSLHADWRDP